MSTLSERALLCAAALCFAAQRYCRRGGAGYAGPDFGRPATADEITAWDISIPPERQRAAARQRDGEAGSRRLRCEVRRLPRRKRGRQTGRPAGWRHRDAGLGNAGQNRRQLLALCDNAVRLCAARDADGCADVVDQRRGLCCQRLHAVAEWHHSAGRSDERANATPGEDAESRRLRRLFGKVDTTERMC